MCCYCFGFITEGTHENLIQSIYTAQVLVITTLYIYIYIYYFLIFVKFSIVGEGGLGGVASGPFLGKYSSMEDKCKKGSASVMDYKVLETATNNFRESDILGEGGFGCVYKARLEEDLYVAVKRLEGGSQDAVREFEVCFCFFFGLRS